MSRTVVASKPRSANAAFAAASSAFLVACLLASRRPVGTVMRPSSHKLSHMTVFVNLSCVTDSDVSRGFLYRLGRWSARHAVAVILIWVSLVVGAVIGNRALGGVYADNFALPGTSAQQAADLLQAHRPSAGGQGGLIVFAVSSGSLTSQRSAIEQSMTAVRELPDVLGASDPLAPTAIAKSSQIGYSSAHVSVNYGGQLGQAAKLKNRDPRSEEIGIIAAFIVLLIGFGSVYAAGLPILSALAGAFA